MKGYLSSSVLVVLGLSFPGISVAQGADDVFSYHTTTPGGASHTMDSIEYGPHLQWARALGDDIAFGFVQREMASPLVVGDWLVLGSTRTEGLQVLDRHTGLLIERWQGLTTVEADLLFDQTNERVFAADIDGHIAAYELDGNLLWMYEAGEALGVKPLLMDHMLFVQTLSGQVTALDPSTGEWLWSYGRDAHSETSILGTSGVVSGNQRVYAGFSDGALVAFSPETGALLWESPLANPDAQWHDLDVLAQVDGCLFASTYEGPSFCIDPENGTIQWSLAGGASAAPLLAEGLLLIPQIGGEVVAVDPENGEESWRWQAPASKVTPNAIQVLSEPVLWDGHVVFPSNRGLLYGLDAAQGRLVWTYRPWIDRFGFSSRAEVTGESLYLLSGGGDILHMATDVYQPPPVLSERQRWLAPDETMPELGQVVEGIRADWEFPTPE